ncbi:MAG: hypothetical protein AB1750_18635 [Chloroflexota bacterium]
MNVYFACSIAGGREYQPVCQAIVRALLADGREIPTVHLAEAVQTARKFIVRCVKSLLLVTIVTSHL